MKLTQTKFLLNTSATTVMENELEMRNYIYFHEDFLMYDVQYSKTIKCVVRKFIIVKLSICKLGSSSVLIVLIVLMKIRAYGSKALQK